MAHLLLDLGTYLQNLGLIQGDGIDYFRDSQPDSPIDVVTAYEYAGSALNLGAQATVRSVQVTVRASTAAAGRDRCWELYHALRAEERQFSLVPGRPVVAMLRSTPIKIRVSPKGHTTWGFNVGITTRLD